MGKDSAVRCPAVPSAYERGESESLKNKHSVIVLHLYSKKPFRIKFLGILKTLFSKRVLSGARGRASQPSPAPRKLHPHSADGLKSMLSVGLTLVPEAEEV